MAVLTPAEALDVCYQAGFRWNQGIVVMPAIGWAESRLKTDARGYNRDAAGNVKSVDRGWLQINTVHTEISDADCDDPLKAAQFAFKLSNQGTKFSPWATYNSGAYRGPEGLTYALFLAEWRDKAGRMNLSKAQAELVGVVAANEQLARVLAETTTELEKTAADLDSTGAMLAALTSDFKVAQATIEQVTRDRDAANELAIARGVKIDNAKAALA